MEQGRPNTKLGNYLLNLVQVIRSSDHQISVTPRSLTARCCRRHIKEANNLLEQPYPQTHLNGIKASISRYVERELMNGSGGEPDICFKIADRMELLLTYVGGI